MSNNEDEGRRSSVVRFPSLGSATGAQHLTLDTQNLSPPPASPKQTSRSDTDVLRGNAGIDATLASPTLRQRRTQRAATFKTVEDFDEFDTDYSARPGWQPGRYISQFFNILNTTQHGWLTLAISEPGYDPDLADGGHASMPNLNVPCTVTCVDFAVNAMEKKHFENESFIEFLDRPKPKWASCRWLNVSGLSWNVVQKIGAKKNLHKLALEDVMTMNNRVKADWYPNVCDRDATVDLGLTLYINSTHISFLPSRSSSTWLMMTTPPRRIPTAACTRQIPSTTCDSRS